MSSLRLGLLTLGRHTPVDLMALGEVARRSGFERLWYADERFFRDCWATLGFLSGRLPEIGLGVCVTDPFVRHPALTAAAAATVHEMSGGRFTLGLGAGISGLAAMGIERARPLTAMREAIELIRSLWAGGPAPGGEVVTFHGALDFPAPPHIPIMIATNGPRMLELAGELADEVMVQGLASPTMIDRVRQHVATGAERIGREPGEVRLTARLDVCMSDDSPNEARRAMRRGLVRHLATHHPRYASFELAGIDVPEDLAAEVAGIGYRHSRSEDLEQRLPEEWIDRFCLAGTSSDVGRHVEELARAGVDAITMAPVALPGTPVTDSVSQFASVTRSSTGR